MSDCPDTEIDHLTIDTSEAMAALEQLEAHGKMTAAEVMHTTHKVYTSLTLMAEMVGMVVPQWIDMMFGAVFMMAQTMHTVGEALITAGTVNPLFAVQATFAFLSASLMFAQAFSLMGQKREADQQMGRMMSLLNTWSI